MSLDPFLIDRWRELYVCEAGAVGGTLEQSALSQDAPAGAAIC
jgi:hypothetical protein